jgi:hypothetical protein
VKSVVVCAAVAAAVMSLVTAAPAGAEEPVLHHVKYTVGASQPMRAEIYYRDVDPPNWADYSHNPYMFSPNVEADLGPGKPWVLEAMLADPTQWAMVIATTPEFTQPLADPGFVCELRVDDVVVATDAGPKGALCSLRSW